MEPILSVRDLAISFDTEEGGISAVSGVSFDLWPGRTLGLVGESGCGKSVSCHAILGLMPENGNVERGEILYAGRDLLRLDERELCQIRGREIAMIFQDPVSALNPLIRIGRQITESLRLHRGMSRRDAETEAVELLARVGIPKPAERLGAYPHELSGGMNQRIMIAMAMACRPKVLIADEPTTALDVTIQAQILDLIRQLQEETGMALVLVTHDLGVVAEMADEVGVMYMGRIVESGPVASIFLNPRHPYTRGLLDSLPSIDGSKVLTPIAGSVPSPLEIPSGCAFEPRCPSAVDRCSLEVPGLRVSTVGSKFACFNPAVNS
ncbi:MAG: hypothetical protein RLZ98_776 [Pseudomonadota bacterium]